MRITQSWLPLVVVSTTLLTLSGCYEELDDSVQPQSQGSSSAGNANDGLIAPVQQPGSSALGKAKSAANNVAEQAEQHSQNVVDQADDLVTNPDGAPN